MIVYLAQDILAFVMYCVNGESGSSLLIESTDSLIYVIGSEKSILMAQNEKKIIFLRRAKVTSVLSILKFVSGE